MILIIKKIIACICSAAQLLISAKVVKNRNVSGYYDMKDDIINVGLTMLMTNSCRLKSDYYSALKDLGPGLKSFKYFYKFNS